MKIGVMAVAFLLFLGTAGAAEGPAGDLEPAEYKAGWDAVNFFNEIQMCEAAIVLPAIKAFSFTGTAQQHSEEQVRRETMSLLPLFEHGASAACHCAMNEIAKLKDYKAYYGTGDFTARARALLNAQLDGPICKGKLEEAGAKYAKEHPRPRA